MPAEELHASNASGLGLMLIAAVGGAALGAAGGASLLSRRRAAASGDLPRAERSEQDRN